VDEAAVGVWDVNAAGAVGVVDGGGAEADAGSVPLGEARTEAGGLVWSGGAEGVVVSVDGVARGVLGGVDDGLAEGLPEACADGFAVAVAVAVAVGVGLAWAVAGTPGAARLPLCQANPTYPPSGTVSDPAATEA
jgi:hypothetical protein